MPNNTNNAILANEGVVPITIDFNGLNEGSQSFSDSVEMIMRALTGGYNIPINLRGTQAQLSSFINSIKKEHDYFKSIKRYGPNDPQAQADRYNLEKAIREFERKNGIPWPMK